VHFQRIFIEKSRAVLRDTGEKTVIYEGTEKVQAEGKVWTFSYKNGIMDA